jgi:signal transduction histidine kinase
MPHAVCWAASPKLVWTMVVTNFITFLSYLVICCTLLYLAQRTKRVIARDWAYFTVGFALFIVACGSTHLLEVITTWDPIFWVDAWTNIITALLSGYVAVQLIRRASVIGFGINDYAGRLGNAEEEKRRMEASLLAARKLEDWSRMSAVVAHEIANPLETVHNLLYLIRTQENVSPEIVRLAATADEEAARVLTISRNTLSFFRQSAEPESVDLFASAESVRMVLAPLLAAKHISLLIQSYGDVTAQAYAGELRQVLLNLVRNACDATNTPGSDVLVQLTGMPEFVEIVVTDHGSGIPPAILPDLFNFGTSTKGNEGNGMGLWTVKHILDRHHATIDVQSTLGQGTTFTIHWPRTLATELPQKQLAAHA